MRGLEALRGFGEAISRLTERWIPNAFAICMALTAVVIAAARSAPAADR